MSIAPPGMPEMQTLLGDRLFLSWRRIVAEIEARRRLDKAWHTGGKKWRYELKFRKGSKTIMLFADEAWGAWLYGCLRQTGSGTV